MCSLKKVGAEVSGPFLSVTMGEQKGFGLKYDKKFKNIKDELVSILLAIVLHVT